MIEINGEYYAYSLKFKATAARRGIVLRDVELVVQEPDERTESEVDPLHRFLYQKFIGNRWITVVVDEQEKLLVTVWANDPE